VRRGGNKKRRKNDIETAADESGCHGHFSQLPEILLTAPRYRARRRRLNE
jgi:hypothetical protein